MWVLAAPSHELEKALEETWKNKEKFYEDTKELSMLEIIKRIESKYKTRGTAHIMPVYATPPADGLTSSRPEV
jgi:hypothetical protein